VSKTGQRSQAPTAFSKKPAEQTAHKNDPCKYPAPHCAAAADAFHPPQRSANGGGH
jgi:hypothetical protein